MRRSGAAPGIDFPGPEAHPPPSRTAGTDPWPAPKGGRPMWKWSRDRCGPPSAMLGPCSRRDRARGRVRTLGRRRPSRSGHHQRAVGDGAVRHGDVHVHGESAVDLQLHPRRRHAHGMRQRHEALPQSVQRPAHVRGRRNREPERRQRHRHGDSELDGRRPPCRADHESAAAEHVQHERDLHIRGGGSNDDVPVQARQRCVLGVRLA